MNPSNNFIKRITYNVLSKDNKWRFEKISLEKAIVLGNKFTDENGDKWSISSHDKFTVDQIRNKKFNKLKQSYPVELNGDMANQFNESFYNDDNGL